LVLFPRECALAEKTTSRRIDEIQAKVFSDANPTLRLPHEKQGSKETGSLATLSQNHRYSTQFGYEFSAMLWINQISTRAGRNFSKPNAWEKSEMSME